MDALSPKPPKPGSPKPKPGSNYSGPYNTYRASNASKVSAKSAAHSEVISTSEWLLQGLVLRGSWDLARNPRVPSKGSFKGSIRGSIRGSLGYLEDHGTY